MSLLVPHGWQLALIATGLVAVIIASGMRGRTRALMGLGFGGLALLTAGGAGVFLTPPALIAEAPLAPLVFHPVFAKRTANVHLTIRDESFGAAPAATLAPAYFSLPAHTVVTLTIVSFDTLASPPPAYYAPVRGTIGGVESVNGRTVSRVPVGRVAHTVTAPALGLNVPVPAARQGVPARVVVRFLTPAAGLYEWFCTCPCGNNVGGWGYPMFQAGMMRGEIRVN